MSKEICKKCGKQFNVSEHNLLMPGTQEKEPITCPYCGYTIDRLTNGFWRVSKAKDS